MARVDFAGKDHDPQRLALIGATALTSQSAIWLSSKTQKRNLNSILNQCPNVVLSKACRSLGFEGPSFCINSACASGNQAIHIAHELLVAGAVDCAFVCGFEFPLVPVGVAGFSWLKAMFQKGIAGDRARMIRPR